MRTGPGECSAASNLGPRVNSSYNNWYPGVGDSTDVVFVSSDLFGGLGRIDIWRHEREPGGA